MRETVYGYPLIDVIKVLEMHGYEVRHKSEGKRLLQFGRSHPFPRGLDFKQEALERIRNQISLEDISFKDEKLEGSRSGILPDMISTARLRIF